MEAIKATKIKQCEWCKKEFEAKKEAGLFCKKRCRDSAQVKQAAGDAFAGLEWHPDA